MNKWRGVECPNCGKKGLAYANHPHAQGWKDYDHITCRYCHASFPSGKVEEYFKKLTERILKSKETEK